MANYTLQTIRPKLIYEYISGSHSYGLNTQDSDIDLRGVFILPLNERLSILDYNQELANDKQDIKYYELKKFLKLLIDANPAVIESLWITKDCVKLLEPKMQMIIDNKELFITKKAYFTHSGYAYSQISKCKGQNKLVHNPRPIDPPKKEDFCWIIPVFFKDSWGHKFGCMKWELAEKLMESPPCRPIPLKEVGIDLKDYHVAALEHVSNTYRLYNYGSKDPKGVFRGNDMLVCESIPLEDEELRFSGLLIYIEHEYEKAMNDWKNYWNWIKTRNEKRWLDQENKTVDYDVKNMSHCFRLLYSGKNIFKNGEPIVRFEGEQRQFLMDIRKNKFTYEYLMELVEKEMKELDELKEKSTLPWGCDVKKVNELYLNLILDK